MKGALIVFACFAYIIIFDGLREMMKDHFEENPAVSTAGIVGQKIALLITWIIVNGPTLILAIMLISIYAFILFKKLGIICL